MGLCVSARLAPCAGGTDFIAGYHGQDVVLRTITAQGFEAELRTPVDAGAIMRLRIPGAGNLLVRIVDRSEEHLRGEFLNGLAQARLRSIVGITTRQP
jgi:hypothetical protein